MTTPNWEERFEEVVRPFGGKGTLFLVPDIDASCEVWAITQKEDDIKHFIRTELENTRIQTVRECMEVVRGCPSPNITQGTDIAENIRIARSIDRGDALDRLDQLTSKET